MSIFNHSVEYYFTVFSNKSCNYAYFIKNTKDIVSNYKKDIQKIIFLDNLFLLVKGKFDRHLLFCSNDDCRFVKYYQTIIFYLQSEIDFLETVLPNSQLTKIERFNSNVEINSIIKNFNDLKEKNINKYSYFVSEVMDMKNFYYLDKKIWKQLFIGKVYDMENKDVINMTHRKILISKINLLLNDNS